MLDVNPAPQWRSGFPHRRIAITIDNEVISKSTMIDDLPFYFLMSLIATSGLKAGWVSKHILNIYTTKIEMCKFPKVIALLSRFSCNFNEKIKI